MVTKKASAVWTGNLRNGEGKVDAGSGSFSVSFRTPNRFETAEGTSPEELIAAAHAGCYSMALSNAIDKQGGTPRSVQTRAACTIEKVGEGFKITTMQLDVEAEVENMSEADFLQVANAAKDGCPVSGALAGNVDIKLNARLK